MRNTDVRTVEAAATAFKAFRPRDLGDLVRDEPQWRARPSLPASSAAPRVIAARWRTLEHSVREVSANSAAESHVVAIVIRNMNCQFSVSGRVVQDGFAAAGLMHVTEPARDTRCVFNGPAEILHLHVPNSLIAECGRDVLGAETAGLRSAPALQRDPIVEKLGRALMDAEHVGEALGPLYADCVSMAIVARLVASTQQARAAERPKAAALPKWRLKRALDYIEAQLAEPVCLADIAAAAGLTRMYFAAQFKAATGLRPHEYLLRRRIERAQEMLAKDEAPLVDIALSVGFQTQSHFTTVFKRFVGQPPRAWRRAHGGAGEAFAPV
jgi:AraC-like DNA-binding protein